MAYDFTVRVNRKGDGSAKWNGMYEKKPNVSPGIVPLSVADMELPEPPEIVKGLKEHLDQKIVGYTSATPEYNQAVAGWMKNRHGWDIKTEWLVQSPGVVPAFFTAVRAFTEPGDGVIIQPPVYYPFFMAIEHNKRTLVRNPLVRDDKTLTYTIDYADLEAKAKDPKNKMLILCSPHNPVGRVWKKEELQKMSEICLKHNVLMFSDEIHFDLLAPGVRHTVYATLSKEAEQNCIVATAPSKTFNLAGMQASNIIIPNKEIREKLQAEFMKSALFMIGNLGLKACELAYTRCGPWLDEFLVLLKGNCDYVTNWFSKNAPKIKVYPLEGTYLLWLDFRALGLSNEDLEKFMINDADWFTDEGYLFGEEGSGFERINLACPRSVLEEALERLGKAIAARKFI